MRAWEVRYHALVDDHDLRRLNPDQKRRVIRAIHKKLSLDPEAYGKPLVGDLAGFWRLRVEQHRVIYRLEREARSVHVVMVGPRRDEEVYEEFLNRLKRAGIGGI